MTVPSVKAETDNMYMYMCTVQGWAKRCDHETKEHFSSAPSIFSRLRRPCHARHVTAHRKI